jgi:hypothetical protein
VTRGVWRRTDDVDDLAGRCAALLSAAPGGAVVAGRAAAELHGLWLPPELQRPIELVLRRDVPVPRDHSHSKRPELRGRRRQLDPSEIVVVDGLPVTSAERTWVDLAECMTFPDLIALGDCVLRGQERLHDLRAVISRARHRRGVVRARAALPLLDARSRSRPESHLRYALISAGLPAPDVNVAIYTEDGEWLGEPDLSYRDARLALEYNGRLHATVERMRKDMTRDIDIQSRGGWRTLTVGPDQVFKRPEQTASFVRELRRERLLQFRRTA